MSIAPEALPLLCNPLTHESLCLAASDRMLATLSGRRFLIVSDIPVLLEDTDIIGQNEKYRTLYDRFAPFYDLGVAAFALLRSGGIEQRRREYLDDTCGKAPLWR